MSQLLKSKRGSHVGMILSFVVFVTFLFFVLTVLNPIIKQQESKQTELDLIKNNLKDSLSSNLYSSSLKVDDAANYLDKNNKKTCFAIDLPAEFGDNIVVKDVDNQLVNFGTTPARNLKIVHGEKKFFKIFYAESFVVNSILLDQCVKLDEEDYTLSSVRTSEYFFEEDIKNILNEYVGNYSFLKNELGVSEENEFGINFINKTGGEISQGFDTQVAGNIYIDEILIQYYDVEANIKSGVIKLRIW